MFVFTNKRKVSLKILVYDGQGYWLCIKRFSEGKLKWWPTWDADIEKISAQALKVLLHQGIPEKANMKSVWKPIATPIYPQAAFS